jgi:hypothetical protein
MSLVPLKAADSLPQETGDSIITSGSIETTVGPYNAEKTFNPGHSSISKTMTWIK